ncbi:MAG: SAM-dependent chlorinase/fluorinase [Solirubrobacterales bacterium]|nr:SAM-dependent chlorinase/fluorinase [Solirubrobacterales bacterium]
MTGTPIVSLLTDYGRDDEFVGVCHGVILGIAPEARIIDLTHEIPRHDVRRGAIVLRNSLPYVRAGVHMAVVDPQVGGDRRALAVGCSDGTLLVGPDNGLLSLAWDRCGGVDLAVDISLSRHRLEPVSSTFHGRDLFAPVAAALASGAELVEAGEQVDSEQLERIALPHPIFEPDGSVIAHVVTVDAYGNVTLDITHDQLAGTGLMLGVTAEIVVDSGEGGAAVQLGGGRLAAPFVRTFADVGPHEAIVYEDASRALAIAINRGDAAAELGLRPDDEVRLRPR